MGRKIPGFEKILTIILIVLSIWIIWPFITSLLLAAVTAYTLNPIVNRLRKHIKSYNLSLIITSVLIFSIIGWTIVYASGGINNVVSNINQLSKETNKALLKIEGYLNEMSINVPGSRTIIESIQKAINDLVSKAKISLVKTLGNIPNIMLNLAIYIVATYYFLRDGHYVKEEILKYINGFEGDQKRILKSFVRGLDNSLEVLFVCYIAMAAIIGFLSWIGYKMIGVPYAGLLALITAIFGFLPIVNTFIIYTLISIYFLYIGQIPQAIATFSYGIIVLSLIPDLILRPYLSSKLGNVHPLTILLGFFGGPMILGFKGFLLGPLILVIAETVIKEYIDLRNGKKEIKVKKL